MDAYIYCADIYCADCGRAIRKQLKREGHAPADPRDGSSYDSDEYPKGPFEDGGGEADCPQHCGSGIDCLNAITLLDNSIIGAFLENPLTQVGYQYVREMYLEDSASELVQLWVDYYPEAIKDE